MQGMAGAMGRCVATAYHACPAPPPATHYVFVPGGEVKMELYAILGLAFIALWAAYHKATEPSSV